MSSDLGDFRSRLNVFQRVTTYGPLLVTVIILFVQTFVPSLIESLPLSATSAIVAGCVLILVWHIELSLVESKESITQLGLRIGELENTQKSFMDSTMTLTQSPLGSAFGAVAADAPRVGHLRVYAISSQQILSFFKYHDMVVDKCHVLLRGFNADDESNRDFLIQIRLVIADWRRLQTTGRIAQLEIRHYDFFPTEYECIFDHSHLVLGLYDSDPLDYSGVRVRDPILVRGTSDGARGMIAEFADRFDRLFEVCATHHGPNVLSG